MLNTERTKTIEHLLDCIRDTKPLLVKNTILIEKNEESSRLFERSNVSIEARSTWGHQCKVAERDFDLDELVDRSGLDIDSSMSAEEMETIITEWTEDDDRDWSDELSSFYGYDYVDDRDICDGHTESTITVVKTSNVVELDGCEYLEIPFIKYLHSLLLDS